MFPGIVILALSTSFVHSYAASDFVLLIKFNLFKMQDIFTLLTKNVIYCEGFVLRRFLMPDFV